MGDWGEARFSDEVRAWLRGLQPKHRPIALAKIALLETFGPTLKGEHSTRLRPKLYELRFGLDRQAWRITYYFVGREIVLLTVFRKTTDKMPREIDRAERAMLADRERRGST